MTDDKPRNSAEILGGMMALIDDGIMRRPDDYRYQRLRELADELEHAVTLERLEASLMAGKR